jgi:hypothetical protein
MKHWVGRIFSKSISLKSCQYVMTNEKIHKKMKYVSIKSTQEDVQKCIT